MFLSGTNSSQHQSHVQATGVGSNPLWRPLPAPVVVPGTSPAPYRAEGGAVSRQSRDLTISPRSHTSAVNHRRAEKCARSGDDHTTPVYRHGSTGTPRPQYSTSYPSRYSAPVRTTPVHQTTILPPRYITTPGRATSAYVPFPGPCPPPQPADPRRPSPARDYTRIGLGAPRTLR